MWKEAERMLPPTAVWGSKKKGRRHGEAVLISLTCKFVSGAQKGVEGADLNSNGPG